MATASMRYGNRRQRNPRSRRHRASFLSLVMAIIVALSFVSAGSVRAEHTAPVVTLNFSGSGQLDTQAFDIPQDSALYIKLKSYTPTTPGTNKPVVGFRNPNQYLCPARYDSLIEDAATGVTYGPLYMEAESYQSYFYYNTGVDAYAMEIQYRQQVIPNDAEPNDTSDIAQELGKLPSIAHITGHLGYLGCVHDKKDFQRFAVTVSGDYHFDFLFDSPFRETAECKLYFHLLDETSSTWVLSYTGPQNGNDLGPKHLDAGHSYLMSMEASGCYRTVSEGGGIWVVDNKAGAYEVTLTSQQTPPPGPPFTVTSVSIVPSVLFWGRDADLAAIIENNGGNPISNVAVEIRVERNSDNAIIAQKTLTVSLTPYQQRELSFTLSELLGGQNSIDRLREDTYDVTVVARQSQLGHESTAAGIFSFYRDIARILGALRGATSLLLGKEK